MPIGAKDAQSTHVILASLLPGLNMYKNSGKAPDHKCRLESKT